MEDIAQAEEKYLEMKRKAKLFTESYYPGKYTGSNVPNVMFGQAFYG